MLRQLVYLSCCLNNSNVITLPNNSRFSTWLEMKKRQVLRNVNCIKTFRSLYVSQAAKITSQLSELSVLTWISSYRKQRMLRRFLSVRSVRLLGLTAALSRWTAIWLTSAHNFHNNSQTFCIIHLFIITNVWSLFRFDKDNRKNAWLCCETYAKQIWSILLKQPIIKWTTNETLPLVVSCFRVTPMYVMYIKL